MQIKINGVVSEVQPGMTILEAARKWELISLPFVTLKVCMKLAPAVYA